MEARKHATHLMAEMRERQSDFDHGSILLLGKYDTRRGSFLKCATACKKTLEKKIVLTGNGVGHQDVDRLSHQSISRVSKDTV